MMSCNQSFELIHNYCGFRRLSKRQRFLRKLNLVRSNLFEDNLGLYSKYVAIHTESLEISTVKCYHLYTSRYSISNAYLSKA